MNQPALQVGKLAASLRGSAHRVEAEADGEALWFESDDAPLGAAPEAFASALLIPALHQGRRLAIDAPLCPEWLSNVERLLPILGKWWGHPQIAPEGSRRETAPTARAETGLCFSGGVDSFFTLLRSGRPIHILVFVHGFDIPLEDEPRLQAFEPSFREVAAAAGKRAILIRTNLRQHRSFSGINWEISHGGALAAIGHILSDTMGSLIVSSSFPAFLDLPWGSDPRIDPLWSSSRLQVIHYGESHWRRDKLRAIAREPLVQKHLRVCWANRSPEGNCSRCEKCLRTMLGLSQCGRLQDFPGFDREGDWASRLDALPPLNDQQVLAYRSFLEGGLPADQERAVRRLLRRSRKGKSFLGRLAGRLLSRRKP